MGGIDQQNEPGALDAIREQTSKIEDFLDTLSDPVKPYVLPLYSSPSKDPAEDSFEGSHYTTYLDFAWIYYLLTSMFLQILTSYRTILNCCYILGGCIEDNYTMERSTIISARLPTQYAIYLSKTWHSIINSILVPNGLTHLFLIVNVIAMFSCSSLVIARRYSDYAVGGLIGVVVVQAVGYGLIFDLNFFLRNLSVMGGLLMVLSDSWVRKSKAFAGLPEIDEKDRKMYFQLAGRVLLIFLFIGFVFSGTWSVWRVIVALFGLVACVMVVVGFKAKFSAIMLVLILSVFNVLVNNFWTVSRALLLILDVLLIHYSFTNTTPTRISQNTISSKFYLLLEVFSSLSTADQGNIRSMRRRRSIKLLWRS